MGKFYASENLERSFHGDILENAIRELFKPEIVVSSTIKDETAEIVLNVSKEESLHFLDLDSIGERTFLMSLLSRTSINSWSVGAKLMIREIPNRDKLTVELSLEKL